MYAIRLARTHTGCDKILKLEGAYHGMLADAAGLKTLEILRRPGTYEKLRGWGEAVMQMLKKHPDGSGAGYQIVGDPVLFDVVFAKSTVRAHRDVMTSNSKLSAKFNNFLRQNGIFRSAGKTYPSLSLTEADLAMTDDAIGAAAEQLFST